MSCNNPVSFCLLLYDSGVAIGVYNEAQRARRSERDEMYWSGGQLQRFTRLL